MGLLKAIRWLSDMGMSNAIFELDCNLVVDRINSFDIDFSKSDSIILQCKNILMQNLINSVKLARLMLVLKKFIIYPHVYFKLWLMKYLDLVFVTKKKINFQMWFQTTNTIMLGTLRSNKSPGIREANGVAHCLANAGRHFLFLPVHCSFVFSFLMK